MGDKDPMINIGKIVVPTPSLVERHTRKYPELEGSVPMSSYTIDMQTKDATITALRAEVETLRGFLDTLENDHAAANLTIKNLRAALALLGAECRAWRQYGVMGRCYSVIDDARLATDSSPTAAAAVKGST